MGAAADIGIVALPHDKLGTIMWTSLQNLGYMVITTHYVDADFNLRAKCATGGISWTGGGLTDGIRYVITREICMMDTVKVWICVQHTTKTDFIPSTL